MERVLGRGGMAVVYLARDRELERPVAIKVLAENLAADGEFRRRFVREARLAARLVHPNVVGVFDAGETDGRPYIVMEYVDGSTLADELARRGRFALEEAVGLALQACAGLGHAHAAGLVHRDVKPHNLLLRRDGVLKVADFGVARAAESTLLTQVGTVLGTAAYLAPEQAEGERVTAAADVYALGAVLYELLAGRPPYAADSLAELAARRKAGEIAPLEGVPAPLEDLVRSCLARNPAYRPSTAGALAGELAALAPNAPTAPLPIRPRRRHARRTWLSIAAAAALAAVAAGLAVAIGSDSKPTSSPPPRIEPVARGRTPAQQAANLAAWLRRHSR